MSIFSKIISEIQVPMAAIEGLIGRHAEGVLKAAEPEIATLIITETAKINVIVTPEQAQAIATVLTELVRSKL